MKALGYFLLALVFAYPWAKLGAWEFYRAYFRQKQLNMGKDPDQVIRQEFRSRLFRWLL